MTGPGAIYAFLASFGIAAYTSASVPEDAEMPYLTYDLATDSFEEGEVALAVSLWYRTSSEAEPNAKAEEIRRAIGRGGRVIRYDDGAVWVKRGSPWCQSVTDEDNTVKRRYINITLEYLTA